MAGVSVKVGADTTEFEAGMKRSRQQLNQLGSELREGATNVAKFGAATVLAAAGGLTLLAAKGLENVDALAKLSRQTGGTIKGVQGLNRVADRAGVSQGAMASAMGQLNVRLGEAMEGSGKAADRLNMLGLSAESLSRMDVDERMATLSDAMQGAGMSSAEMANSLRDLGIRGTEMTLLMQEGGDAIRASTGFMEDYGLALSEVDAAKVEAANDSFADVQEVLGGIGQQLALEVAPLLDAVSKMFLDSAKEAGGFGEITSNAFESIVSAIGFTMDAMDGVRRVFVLAGQAGALAFSGLTVAVLSVADTIISGPTRAMNDFIDLLNKIPGVNIEQVGMSGLGESIQRELELAKGATAAGMQAMHETLMEPMPSVQFKQFVAEAKEAAQEAAEAQVAARADMGHMLLDQEDQLRDELSEKRREKLEKEIESLKAANDTELEILQQKADLELELLRESLENELITKEEFAELEEQSKQRHEDALNEIDKKASKERMDQAKKEAKIKEDATATAIANTIGLMNSGSKKLFKIGKAAALSQAVVDGQAAIVGAYKVGSSIGGPVLGAAYGAVAGAATMQRINQIRSQSFGGGGGGGSSGGSMGGGQNPTAPEPISQQQQQRGPEGGTLTVQGLSASSLLTGSAVAELAEELLEYQRTGGRVVFG